MYLVDSFPMPLCDKKRAGRSTSALTCSDATGTHATYGYCATKGLGWFFGFRCSVITTDYGVPVDFAIACANIDDRAVLEALCERGKYPILVGDKGYISEALATLLFQRSARSERYPDWIEGSLSVSPQGKLSTQWGDIKSPFSP